METKMVKSYCRIGICVCFLLGIFACKNKPVEPTEPPMKQANRIVQHYWDNFNFSDTTLLRPAGEAERTFVKYSELLSYADPDYITQSIDSILTKAEAEESGKTYTHFLDLFEKYFYDPNSPLRDEEIYIPVLKYITNNPRMREIDKARPAYRLKMLLKNRMGETATDFTYTLPSGDQHRLYEIQTPYTLMMFYNPDCHACGEVIQALKASPMLSLLQQNKQVQILAFYPDKDLQIWKKHWRDIPQNWINGYDQGTRLRDEDIYDLKAIPTLYLLDKDKKVLLKDVDIPRLEQWLQVHFNQ
jgi:hypothetical protein